LQQALTHRSHSSVHNERLEFLGDSILNCVVASILYERFNHLDEGDLSRLRANLVKQQSLFEIAQKLELSQFLRLGEGELKSGGFRRPSILADTLEALLGAIFLDAGFDAAREAIRAFYIPLLDTVDPRTLGKDAKTCCRNSCRAARSPCPPITSSPPTAPPTARNSRSNAWCPSSASRCSAAAAAAAPANRPPRAWRWKRPSRRCRRARPPAASRGPVRRS
jgi:dsRNA-specific ribonuclease